MALSDPLAVKTFILNDSFGVENYVPHLLPLVNSGENKAAYGAPDAPLRVSVSHAYGKRTRRTVRVDLAKEAPNTWNPSQNSRYTMSCYIVIDEPVSGFTDQEVAANVLTLCNILSKAGTVAGGQVEANTNLEYITQGVS